MIIEVIMYSPTALNLRVVKFDNNEVLCYCPFHDDHTPTSFFFNVITGLFDCFACGAHGNVQQLASFTHGTIENAGNLKQYSYRKIDLSGFMEFPCVQSDYLIKRGLSLDTVKTFDIRSNNHQIIFPFYDALGGLKGVQVRYMRGDTRYRIFGDKLPFYPFRPFKPQPVFIVEGVFGVLRAYRANVQAITFLGSKSLPSDFAKGYLTNQQQSIIIAYDNDKAGYEGAINLDAHLNHWTFVEQGREYDELSDEQWKQLNDKYIVEID